MSKKGSILFWGHSYYHNLFLAKELEKLGWRTTTVNTDDSPDQSIFYSGQDIQLTHNGLSDMLKHLLLYSKSLYQYDIFHFSATYSLKMLNDWYKVTNKIPFIPWWWDIKLLKKLGKKIVYANNGCHDGLLQSTFASQGYYNTCSICRWQNEPSICSDKRMQEWGEYRNAMADAQIHNGGHRHDYNDNSSVHYVPEYYCVDPDYWDPDVSIPEEHLLKKDSDVIRIYHAVGNYDLRSRDRVNAKCTHIWIPVVEQLKSEGHNVELMFLKNIPNKDVRYYQAQADIVVDMLTYGWFGANIREALTIGKPVICYINDEWKKQTAEQIPDYVEEMPIISATIDTAYETLKELVLDKEKRLKIGRKGREFAIKWHSPKAGAEQLDKLYSSVMNKHIFKR